MKCLWRGLFTPENRNMTVLSILASSIFEIFTLSLYYDHFFIRRNTRITPAFFWGFYVIWQIILVANTLLTADYYNIAKTIFTFTLNMVLFFCMTFLYESSGLLNRFLISFLYLIVGGICEYAAAGIHFIFNPSIFEKSGIIQDAAITTTSELLVFLVISGIINYAKKRERKISLIYWLMFLSIPMISIVLLFLTCVVFVSHENFSLFIPITCCLLILNIICFILFDKTITIYELAAELNMSKRQIEYQSSKYSQISDSYSSTRSIVHDVKKYNRMINSYINNKQYDSLKNLVKENEKTIAKSLPMINTGNLVIDTFIGNYVLHARNENIDFSYSIDVSKEDVPLEDYDLCIIIGNLLDNSFEACRKLPGEDEKKIEIRIHLKDNSFVMYIANAYCKDEQSHKNEHHLIHGYGINNVTKIVEKNHGFYHVRKGNLYETVITIPRIQMKKINPE